MIQTNRKEACTKIRIEKALLTNQVSRLTRSQLKYSDPSHSGHLFHDEEMTSGSKVLPTQ